MLALTGKASDAIQLLRSAIAVYQSTGATILTPWYQAHFARALLELGRFDDARHFISQAVTAVEKTKERWYEAEVNRIAGEIALKSLQPDAAKAEAYFERALAVARAQ